MLQPTSRNVISWAKSIPTPIWVVVAFVLFVLFVVIVVATLFCFGLVFWKPQESGKVSAGDFLTLCWLALTVVGLLFTYHQFRGAKQAEGARFLLDIMNSYFSDTQLRTFFQKLDNENFKFNPVNFHESEDESPLDRTLYTFDLIGRMVRSGVLRKSEVEILRYRVARVMDDSEVKKYLLYLDEVYKKSGQGPAHEDARFLATELRSILGRVGPVLPS